MKEFILFWMLMNGGGSQIGTQPGFDEVGCSRAAENMRKSSSAYQDTAKLEIWCQMARQNEARRK